MKALLISAILATFCLGSVVLAMPAVGDYAAYDIVYDLGGGQVVTGTVEKEVTAFDVNAKSFSVKSSINFAGTNQTQTDVIAATSMVTDDGVSQLLTNCAAKGGTTEVLIVDKQSFNTCAISSRSNGIDAKYWIGAVSFGLLKQVSANGTQTLTLTLRTFKPGK